MTKPLSADQKAARKQYAKERWARKRAEMDALREAGELPSKRGTQGSRDQDLITGPLREVYDQLFPNRRFASLTAEEHVAWNKAVYPLCLARGTWPKKVKQREVGRTAMRQGMQAKTLERAKQAYDASKHDQHFLSRGNHERVRKEA